MKARMHSIALLRKGAGFIENTASRKPRIFQGNPKNGGFLEFPRKFTFNETYNPKEAYLSILYKCFFSFLDFLDGGVLLLPFWGFFGGAYKGVRFFRGNPLSGAEKQPPGSCPHAGVILHRREGAAFGHKIQRSGGCYMGRNPWPHEVCVLGVSWPKSWRKLTY